MVDRAPVTRNFSAQIVLRYASFGHNLGISPDSERTLRRLIVQEQEVNHLALLLIAELCLRGSNCLQVLIGEPTTRRPAS